MMKKFFLSAIFLVSISAQAEFCNWGFVGPKIFECNGAKYYSGDIACDSGFYKKVFCHEKHKEDGKACSTDQDPETKKCFEKMKASEAKKTAPTKHKKQKPKSH